MAHELGRNHAAAEQDRSPLLDPLEAGEAAAFLASDRASAMTGAAANITCGQLAD